MNKEERQKYLNDFFDKSSFVYVLFFIGLYATAFLLWKIAIKDAVSVLFANSPFQYYLAAFVTFTWPLLKAARDARTRMSNTPKSNKALNWLSVIIALYGIYIIYIFVKIAVNDL